MAFNAYSAKNSAVRLGSSTLTAKKWTVTEKSDRLDSTNFESGGYAENVNGIRELTFSIELDDNGALSYTDLGIYAGVIFSSSTPLKLYLNGVNGPYWSIPNPFIESIGHNADVKSTLGLTIQGNATGTYSRPTGTAGTTS